MSLQEWIHPRAGPAYSTTRERTWCFFRVIVSWTWESLTDTRPCVVDVIAYARCFSSLLLPFADFFCRLCYMYILELIRFLSSVEWQSLFSSLPLFVSKLWTSLWSRTSSPWVLQNDAFGSLNLCVVTKARYAQCISEPAATIAMHAICMFMPQSVSLITVKHCELDLLSFRLQ